MPAQGQKFRAAAGTVDRAREYAVDAAVELVKGAAFATFDETVDVAVRSIRGMPTRWYAAPWSCRTAPASRCASSSSPRVTG